VTGRIERRGSTAHPNIAGFLQGFCGFLIDDGGGWSVITQFFLLLLPLIAVDLFYCAIEQDRRVVMTDPISPERETRPWLNSEVLAAIAASLDELLREKLRDSSLAYSSLGETLIQRLSVSKFDSMHEEGTSPQDQFGCGDEELTAITAKLSEELKRQLRDYGASEADVEFAVVRRWDMLAGSKNACSWRSVAKNGGWCTIKTCC